MKYSLRSLMTFSIRDLLWLTIVVAFAVGWWVDHRRAQLEEKRWKAELELAKSTEANLTVTNHVISKALAARSVVHDRLIKALDEASPGWRDTDGRYEMAEGRIVLPKPQASPEIPPKK